jgi:hypothetical protein
MLWKKNKKNTDFTTYGILFVEKMFSLLNNEDSRGLMILNTDATFNKNLS